MPLIHLPPLSRATLALRVLARFELAILRQVPQAHDDRRPHKVSHGTPPAPIHALESVPPTETSRVKSKREENTA